jgi:hypothetical protein
MPSSIFIVETAVDDMKVVDGMVELAIQKLIQLQTKMSQAYKKRKDETNGPYEGLFS